MNGMATGADWMSAASFITMAALICDGSYYLMGWTGGYPAANNPAGWWLGISSEGIGTVGAALNFVVDYVVSKVAAAPPAETQDLGGRLRYPGKLETPAASSH